MKKVCATLLCCALLLAGCGAAQTTEPPPQGAQEITIAFDFGERTGLYTGDYDENNVPHGYGVFTSHRADGTTWTYSGQWEHGHWNGYGSTVWQDGQTYSGEYSNDYVSGFGAYSFPGGDYAIGECNDSGLNGFGMYVTESGEIITGRFGGIWPTGWCAMYLTGVYEGYVFWGYFDGFSSDGVCYTPNGDCVYAQLADGRITVTSQRVEDSGKHSGSEEEEPKETVPEETEPTATEQQVTMGMWNALSRAGQYLKYTAFSYSGLVKQLEFEGYSNEEAVYAADNCGADWNEQAVKKAKQYLDYSAFSKSALISQLEFEGFTHDQAVYAAEQNGF